MCNLFDSDRQDADVSRHYANNSKEDAKLSI